MNSWKFVGIDIAKEKFDVWLGSEQHPHHRVFRNQEAGFQKLVSWLQEFTSHPWVILEATGSYSEPLARYLYQQGIRVSVVNPLQIKNFAKALLARNKNDKLDAKIIALYGQKMEPRLFQPVSLNQKVTRELAQVIDSLKEQKKRYQQQKAHLQTSPAQVALNQTIQTLEQQIQELEKELETSIQQDPQMEENAQRLQTLKGIGTHTAYRLVAYLPEIHGFRNAKQLAAFIGVSPKQQQSGKWKGKTHLTNFGHARLRKILYMPALSAKRYNQHLKPFVKRLQENGLAPKAIVGALMRKLVHLIFGMLKHQQTFNPKLACLQ